MLKQNLKKQQNKFIPLLTPYALQLGQNKKFGTKKKENCQFLILKYSIND